ncbi:MAG: DUF350 domain-containing protein [Bacteroidia bacterium]|jgi:uncharacterized membrane protein YjfL (UPF0719 family)
MDLLILLQAAIAFIMGIASLFLMYKILHTYLKRVFKIELMNTAYATLKAGVLIGNSLLMASVIGPGINAVRFMNQSAVTTTTVSTSLGFIFVFLMIGMVFSFLIIAGGITALFQLTKINEWEEIKNNNIPTAIISAALIVGLSIIMKDHVASVCEMLIPYPEVMQIR